MKSSSSYDNPCKASPSYATIFEGGDIVRERDFRGFWGDTARERDFKIHQNFKAAISVIMTSSKQVTFKVRKSIEGFLGCVMK